MPRYDYRCYACRTMWEDQQLIADRDIPVEAPCPECQVSGEVERYLPSSPIWKREGHAGRVPDSFKDVLRNMKKNHRHSSINV